jgi:hypothetical protein
MRLRNYVLAALAALACAFGGYYAIAQNAGQILFTMLGSELIQIQPSGTAANVYVSTSAMRDGRFYVAAAPVTGFTITMTVLQSALSLNPLGTLATGTVVLPPVQYDGKMVGIFSSQTITALTLSTSNGATFTPAAVTTLPANTAVEYVYSLSANTWYRMQ